MSVCVSYVSKRHCYKIFKKEIDVIKQIHQNNVIIVIKYEPYFCNGCHDLMQKALSFNGVAIVYVKRSA